MLGSHEEQEHTRKRGRGGPDGGEGRGHNGTGTRSCAVKGSRIRNQTFTRTELGQGTRRHNVYKRLLSVSVIVL